MTDANGGNQGTLINPHNPEFLTKKPWYLTGDGNSAAPTLDHQTDQRPDKQKVVLSLTASEQLLQDHRRKERENQIKNAFVVGQWVEALKKGKLPYRICQVVSLYNNGRELDLKYEDGTVERKVKINNKRDSSKPTVRITKTGNRSLDIKTGDVFKESYDGKRDQYHGYDRDTHNSKLNTKYMQRQELRKQSRKLQREEESKKNLGNLDKEPMEESAKKQQRTASDSDFDDSDLESDNDDDNSSDSDDEKEFLQRDEDAKVITSRLARQGGVGGAQMKVTARNLRIREDTAKYLRNLDPNSAYYDPKSRSMRDNPNPEIPTSETDYAGDNFTRITGDAASLAQTQLFAWDNKAVAAVVDGDGDIDTAIVQNSNNTSRTEIHPQANPSQAELLRKKYQTVVVKTKIQQKQAVLSKYGGEEYLDGTDGLASAITDGNSSSNNDNDYNTSSAGTIGNSKSLHTSNGKVPVDRKLRFGETTQQDQYTLDSTGRLVKGIPDNTKQKKSNLRRQPIPCKYEENVYINGHTSVWGSYFHKGAFMWGYSDDHSLLKNSYCTGAKGREANDEANLLQYGTGVSGSAELAQARKVAASMLIQVPAQDGGTTFQQQQHEMSNTNLAKVRDELRKQQQKMSVLDNVDDDQREIKRTKLV